MNRKNVTKTNREVPTVGKKWFFVLVLVVLCLGSFTTPLSAQCAIKNKALNPGEVVTYNLYFNWKFIWLKAGTATLSTKSVVYNNEPCYQLDLLSVSSKRVDFFFRMRDTLTSIVSQRIEPRKYRKGALEGKHYSVDEALFSYRNGLSIVEQTRTYKDGNMISCKDSSYHCIFDMLSILAQARSYDISDYKVGQELKFTMATGKTIVNESLVYQGKENIKADNGVTYRCLVFTFVEYGAVSQGGHNNDGKEVVTFYITDDDNHLPVRLDFFLNFGSAKAFLRDVKGNKYPLTSIVKE